MFIIKLPKPKGLTIACLLGLFLNGSVLAGPIEYFQEKLEKTCPSLNSLLVKKSMIEFHRVHRKACGSRFTKILLEKCEQLSCVSVSNFYQESMSRKAGSIIGEE